MGVTDKDTAGSAGTIAIVEAVNAAARLAAGRAWLGSHAPGSEILVVAPGWEAADDLVRMFAAERGIALGIHRLTLNGLIGRVAAAELAARGLVPLGALAAEAVAARAIHYLRTSGTIGYFAPVADRPGFAAAIAGTLAELRACRVTTDALRSLGLAGEALAILLERFVVELEAAALIDRAGLIELATHALAQPTSPRYAGLPTLMMDLEVASPVEADFLAALGRRAPAVLATVVSGDSHSRALLEGALGVKATTLAASSADCALARLQRHLFEITAPSAGSGDETVTVMSAPGEARECVEVARNIQAAARRGIPLDKIAVLLHSPARHGPNLEEALRRAGLPAYFARGIQRPEPGGRALLALLDCAGERLSARRFGEYLSLAQVPDSPPSVTTAARDSASAAFVPPDPELTPCGLAGQLERRLPADEDAPLFEDPIPVIEGSARAPWRWENLLVEAAVIGGLERWQRRLAGLRAELRLRAQAAESPEQALAIERNLTDLGHLEDVALPIIQALAELPVEATWGEWLVRLRELVALAVRDSEPVMAVLAELEPMAPVGPIGLEELRGVLSERLGNLRLDPPRRRYGAVLVSSPAAARGMSFEVVLVPGLAERLFPRKLVEDPILPDAARIRLSPWLTEQRRRAESERLALRIAAGSAGARLILSYPRIDVDQGRPRVPSFYALEALRAAQGYLPGFDEMAQRTAAVRTQRLGWPAPDDPTEALDDAEFDLAVLVRLLDDDPHATVGAANYLLGANPHLARALRSRARRWLQRWTPADGLVDPEPWALAALARHRLTARSYSATSLQHFAACPYRFLLYTIHRLRPREEPQAIEAIDALTRGSLVHEVQYEILSKLRAAGMLPLGPAQYLQAQHWVDDLLERRADTYKDTLAPAIERVWKDGIDSIKADLREWLRRMAHATDRWSPEHFELAFGLNDRFQADPASRTEPVPITGGLQLRGAIDLIERDPSGRLRATDHKTGKVRAARSLVIGGGKFLQPLLYAIAAERLLEKPVEAGRLYYCTAAGGFEERVVKLDEGARDYAARFAQIVGASLETGFLPAAPQERECRACDYLDVCGPLEEERVRRKPSKRLEPLAELRAMR